MLQCKKIILEFHRMIKRSWHAFMVSDLCPTLSLICSILLVDIVWFTRVNSLNINGIEFRILAIGGWLAFALFIILIARVEKFKPITQSLFCNEIGLCILWVTIFAASGMILAIYSYLCVKVSGSLIDQQLLNFDKYVGLDWVALRRWVNERSLINQILRLSYNSGIYQLMIIPQLLVLFRKEKDVYALYSFFFISAIICPLISIFFPANSLFTVFKVGGDEEATVSHFKILRENIPLDINIEDLQGLISFPSFHTMLGIGFAYYVRNVPVVFPFLLVLNLVMIISTITEGGHYLLDTLLGVLCGISIILFLDRTRTTKSDNFTKKKY